MKRKSRTKRTGKSQRKSTRAVRTVKRKRVKSVIKKGVMRNRRGKPSSREGKLLIRKGSRRGRVKRKGTLTSKSYQSGFNESYNNGYNAGFSKGFEDGHEFAYEQQL